MSTEYIQYRRLMRETRYMTVVSEGIIPRELLPKIEFIKNLAAITRNNITNLFKLIANKQVFKFFSFIKWNIQYLFQFIKKGFEGYRQLINEVAAYIHKSPVGTWTEDKLRKLDAYLANHPKLRRLAGAGVAAILVFIWFRMSFTGDLQYDFDLSDVYLALQGKFTLADLFSGANGTKLLLLFATGSLLGLTFPWPGPNTAKFIGTMLYSLAIAVNRKNLVLKPSKIR